jgi:hypothetical protein
MLYIFFCHGSHFEEWGCPCWTEILFGKDFCHLDSSVFKDQIN